MWRDLCRGGSHCRWEPHRFVTLENRVVAAAVGDMLYGEVGDAAGGVTAVGSRSGS